MTVNGQKCTQKDSASIAFFTPKRQAVGSNPAGCATKAVSPSWGDCLLQWLQEYLLILREGKNLTDAGKQDMMSNERSINNKGEYHAERKQKRTDHAGSPETVL